MSLTVTETEMTTLRPPTPIRSATPTTYLSHLPQHPPLDIEFIDLSYSVPAERGGSKLILRNVSGLFKSGQLTGILGPSGAGKSTLLNALAGYKCEGASGSILINGQPRDLQLFNKLSRYIMQEDLLQPRLTVQESMSLSANLKLGNSVPAEEKENIINEILSLLRLLNTKNTMINRLSGGERKRLSIALELVNNPPVVFLDEPTTGLDDLSSLQCTQLLKVLAEGGRTIICSVHTPSAKLFQMFDNVYVVAQGQCVYQGFGDHIVPFLKTLNCECPMTYNPADFVIEVSSGEYGNFTEAMVGAIDNGKVYRWTPVAPGEMRQQPISRSNALQTHKNEYNYTTSGLHQFIILFKRMLLQQYRDKTYLAFQIILHVLSGVVVGGMYYRMGNDASKTLFNIGYCFVSLISVLYIPLLPILLAFPIEVQMVKREHFNRWYGLTPFFCAYSLSRLPVHIARTTIYVGISYILTGQPLEYDRFLGFLLTLLVVGTISESLGMVISSLLNIVNGIFIGPALCVPLMLFSVYGLSYNRPVIPLHMKLLMHLSYLRYGLEALLISVYGGNRPNMICPETEEYCQYRSPKNVLMIAGMENVNIYVDCAVLGMMFLLFRGTSFILLRWRLTPSSRIAAVQKVAQLVKANLGLTRWSQRFS